MRLYISGPMTGLPNYNYDAFNELQAKLESTGLYVVNNPARNFNGDQGRSKTEYMRADVQQILDSEGLVMLPGWEKSEGATFEVKLAEQIGLPVMRWDDVRRELVDVKTKGMKFDGSKPAWDLLPWGEVQDIVDVLTFGAKKYKPDNWQHVSDPENRYFAALVRHLTAWKRGEGIDDETGLRHLAHAGCCLLFLMWHDTEDRKHE